MITTLNQVAEKFRTAYGNDTAKAIKGRKVLDVGCGEGMYVLAMHELGAAHAEGIDLHEDFAFARQYAVDHGLGGVKYSLGSIEELHDDTFDMVFSHDSFEHFEDPKFMLEQMVRVTKPGGSVHIKFGPPWKNPWGRHMSGSIRKDRPWVHLLLPESMLMRCHSVYHDDAILHERYSQLKGGLNKMTIKRFVSLVRQHEQSMMRNLDLVPLFGLAPVMRIPGLREYLCAAVRCECQKIH